MRVVAISGSLRASSSTSAVLRLAKEVAPPNVEVTFYEGVGDLPHFTPDLDTDEPPAAVQTLRAALREADALLICTPEYAHGMPGSLKNMLDWVVSWPELVGKRIAALSASPSSDGGSYAHAWLVQTLEVMSTNVVATLIVPYVKNRLASNDETLRAELREVLYRLGSM
ncbi:MAG TPA: NAD(P)H-dependent oxidoreductase [Thermoanaerobaculia bacterium]|nr:NAD(P)H-dependent oxidoreductase [Thermoanaerobaculia bacterium]